MGTQIHKKGKHNVKKGWRDALWLQTKREGYKQPEKTLKGVPACY